MSENLIVLTIEQKREIGRRIRQCWLERHYSLEDLAYLVNMGVLELEKVENGDFEMYDDLSTLISLQNESKKYPVLREAISF